VNELKNVLIMQNVGNFLTECLYQLFKKDSAPWS